MRMTDLKVVKSKIIKLDAKIATLDSLKSHITELIYDYCDTRDVNNYEILGALECVKQKFLDDN